MLVARPKDLLSSGMPHFSDTDHPAEAFAPNGVPWWRLSFWPNSRRPYGDERKLAAWLAFNVEIGETFTMRELREALGDEIVPNSAEHLNRRLRNLRPDGWDVPTNNDDGDLPVGVYRLDALGWHPGSGSARPASGKISQGDRRRVLDRDGRRCVVCGVGAGEPYAREPGSSAALTVGHRVPSARKGQSGVQLSNLQTECKRCNEPVRNELRDPENLEELLPDALKMKKSDLVRLESWVEAGFRITDHVDEVFDRYKRLPEGDRQRLKDAVNRKIGGRGTGRE